MKLIWIISVLLFSCSMVPVESQSDNGTYPLSSINLVSFVNLANQYYFSENKASFYEATNFCLLYGMDLAKLEDRTEHDILFAHANTMSGDPFYVGAHKLGRSQWLWLDGTPLTFENWASNEPSSPSSYYCFVISTTYNGWDDQPCNTDANFICETHE